MKKSECVKLILTYAKKVSDYPAGSSGYDPIDLANMVYYVKQYEKLFQPIADIKNIAID